MTTLAPVLRPADIDGLRTAVLDVSGPLAVRGTGTASGWAGRLDSVDAVLDTTELSGVLAHNPGDMTVSVLAGTPLRSLQEMLASHGQRVAFDADRVRRGATVGGLIATADSGPLALRYGTLRDLVIGMTVVLADGTVARSGGHVIKNVAGYDLAKLMHGSYGALAVLAEVVLRLHPIPERSATVVLPCRLPAAAAHAGTVLASPLEPVSLTWRANTLLVGLQGGAAALDGRIDRVRELLGDEARSLAGPVADEQPADEQPADEQPADDEPAAADDAVLRIGCLPSRLPDLLDALPASEVGAELGTGVATVVLPPDTVAEAHRRVHEAGGSAVLRDRPDDCTAPAWGPPPSAVGVLRAVKHALDPTGRLGPGRFAPWM